MRSQEYKDYIGLVVEYEVLMETSGHNGRVTEVLGKMSDVFSDLPEDEQEIIKDIYWYVE